MTQEPETKLPSNESTNPSLKPLCVARTPLEGDCPVCRGFWSVGFGRSNPRIVVRSALAV